jgi:hypothetical protein
MVIAKNRLYQWREALELSFQAPIVIVQINLELPNFFGNCEAALRIESPSVTKATDAGGSFVRSNLGSTLFSGRRASTN